MRQAQAGLTIGFALIVAMAPVTNALVPQDTSSLVTAANALASGSYGDAFRALADQQGLDLPATPRVATAAQALALLSHGDLDATRAGAVLATVPVELMPAVSTLLIGMAKADVLVQGAIGPDERAALASARAGTPSWTGLAWGIDVPADAEGAPVRAPTPDIDEAPFVLAEIVLLDAVARAQPLLANLLFTPDAPGDVVNQKPYILVSNAGNDVYGAADNAILIIDLGGNDVYNNAQGSPFGGTNVAQVIVDLQGNDDYIRSASAAVGTATVRAQGVGITGVGGILDLMGNDEYIATAAYIPGAVDQVNAEVIAQGAAVLGAGFLIDAGGNDCVVATARALGGTASVAAQGSGQLGAGFAALLGGAAPGCLGAPYATALSDPRVIIDNPQQHQEQIGPASMLAQGAGVGGAGAFLGGPTAQTYVATADGGLAGTTAQGAGELGAGLLVDLGGADRYIASAAAGAALSLNLEGFFGGVSTQVTINLGDTVTVAQGAAAGGAGALVDIGLANNIFQVTSSMSADAFSRAATTFSGGATSAVATVNVGRTASLAHGATETGAGVLLGISTPASGAPGLAAGTSDTRSVVAIISAHTDARAQGGANNNAEASTTTGNADASGQGSVRTGAGVLADVGGNDGYFLTSIVDATADALVTPAGVAVEDLNAGSANTDGHTKSTTGVAVLADVDGRDTYSMNPNASPAVEDSCYTNSPPGLPGNTNIGIGIDALTTTTVPANCLPPAN